jgi:hypothetical protein
MLLAHPLICNMTKKILKDVSKAPNIIVITKRDLVME